MKFRAVEIIEVDTILIHSNSVINVELQMGDMWQVIANDIDDILFTIMNYMRPFRTFYIIRHVGDEYIID